MNDDVFKTISSPAQGYITEKKSKFLSFIFPIKTAREAKDILDEYRKKYYDARHVCWAYMLGASREDFRSNDDGEPSGTAGRPILGQINSAELTDVLVIVVRYFGGTLLGTSGLIKAYKEATAAAILNAKMIERTVDEIILLHFNYTLLSEVMRIIKQFDSVTWEQDFAEDCHIAIRVRKSLSKELFRMFSLLYGVHVEFKKTAP